MFLFFRFFVQMTNASGRLEQLVTQRLSSTFLLAQSRMVGSSKKGQPPRLASRAGPPPVGSGKHQTCLPIGRQAYLRQARPVPVRASRDAVPEESGLKGWRRSYYLAVLLLCCPAEECYFPARVYPRETEYGREPNAPAQSIARVWTASTCG